MFTIDVYIINYYTEILILHTSVVTADFVLLVCDLICKNGTRSEEDCSCDCYDGYTGRECETNINDCDPNPCQNGGRCKDLINDYFCNCTEDFDGKQCTNYIGKCPYNYMTGKFL